MDHPHHINEPDISILVTTQNIGAIRAERDPTGAFDEAIHRE